jgi:hypothetical protein
MSLTSSTFAPDGPKPVDVFTKVAPAETAILHALTISSSVKTSSSISVSIFSSSSSVSIISIISKSS